MSGLPPTPPSVSDPPTPDELYQCHMFHLGVRNDIQAAATSAAAATTQFNAVNIVLAHTIMSLKSQDDEPELPI